MNTRYRVHAVSRREFLQESAACTAGAFAFLAANPSLAERRLGGSVAPLRIASIGPGSQGQFDLRKAIAIPGVRCVAVCDIFEPNLNRARQITQLDESDAVSDYRRVLDRSDVDAVLVTVPLPLHAEIAIAALEAGKHVFCEKLMAYSLPDARRMANAARRSGKVLQIGHQRASSVGYNHAWDLLVNKKVCGRVTHVRAQWNRNGSWRRTLPKGRILGDSGFWHDEEHLVNWRLYRRTSQGLMAELASHQVQVVNWFLNAVPTAVVGMAGLDYWKDGRDIWDNVQCIFEYPGGVKLTYQSICTNQFDGFSEEFMGDQGTLITTLGPGNHAMGLLYREPRAETLDWAKYAQTEKDSHGHVGVVLDASATKKLDTGVHIGREQLPASASGKDAYDLELYNWAASIREGKPVVCGPQVGFNTAVAILTANEAMQKGTRIAIPADAYQL